MLKKLSIFVLSFSFLLLAGCAGGQPTPPSDEAPAVSEAGCLTSSACKGEGEICFERECMTLDDIFARYRNCGPDSDSKFYCPGECEGCKDNKYSCLNTLSEGISFHFCGECATNYSCKEGYKCDKDNHKCVPES